MISGCSSTSKPFDKAELAGQGISIHPNNVAVVTVTDIGSKVAENIKASLSEVKGLGIINISQRKLPMGGSLK